MSNAELRGANVIWALSFLEDFERYGFDTYNVPVEVSKPSDLYDDASVIKKEGWSWSGPGKTQTLLFMPNIDG